VKVTQVRSNAYSLTGTRQELGALVAAARMAVDVMRADPRAPREALGLLESVLADWDAAIGREGREGAPPPGPLLDADPGPEAGVS
jgi:hypothetical protein